MRIRPSFIVPALFLVSACASGAGTGPGQLSGDCSRDFGTTVPAKKLTAFIASVNAFSTASTDLDNTLRNACLRMADAMMLTVGNRMDTRAVCTQVSTQLRQDSMALRAQASVGLALDVEPPRCEVNVEAYSNCAAQCDASYTPGMTQVQCEGGELVGSCSAMCTGSCVADVTGNCEGSCEGSCEGTCAQRGPNGECAGQCMGMCRGRCAVRAMADCAGECRGGCSVAYTNPRCTGRVVPPMVSAECRASCDSRLNAEATCTPARVSVRAATTVTGDLETRLNRYRAAIEAGYADVLAVRVKVERVQATAATLVSTGRALPDAVVSVGANAAVCATSAVSTAVTAAASVQVSVEVSVEVSGSVNAM